MSQFSWQLKSLIKKNLLTLKRNIILTLVELIYPIILMIILVIVRQAFPGKDIKFNEEEGSAEDYIIKHSGAYIDLPNLYPQALKTSELYTNISKTATAYKEAAANLATLQAQNMPKDQIDQAKLTVTYLQYQMMYDLGNLTEKYNSSEYLVWKGTKIRNNYGLCMNSDFNRTIVFLIGSEASSIKPILEQFYEMEKNYFLVQGNSPMNFKIYNNYDEVVKYMEQENYDKDENIEKICMGITLNKTGDKAYDFKLHYFDEGESKGLKDVPSVGTSAYNKFQNGPDIENYERYKDDGYNYMMKIVYDFVLSKETNKTVNINFAMVSQKYETYYSDGFAQVVIYLVPEFMMIAYLCPLILFVHRMVGEKESRAKEGMKIMGMNDGAYFLAYFIQFFIFNFVHAMVNSFVINSMFVHVPVGWLLLYFILFGLNVFSMAYLFQSFIDKTRVAVILSILLYYVSSFLYIAIYDDSCKRVIKIVCSIFPTVAVEMAFISMAKFQSGLKDLKASDIPELYGNTKLSDTLIMLTVDFFLYLFLGFYIENIIPHDYGMSKPFYFLCTRSFWCKKSKKKNRTGFNKKIESQLKSETEAEKNKKNFESEEIYKNRNPLETLELKKLVKVFGDNKVAVNNLSLKLYKDEIFALLGHNGSGKTTTLNMLSGLYEATSGEAYYDGNNILEEENMAKFRTILGICPQHDVLFPDLTVGEHLEMFCTFKGFPSDKIADEVEKTLKDFRIYDIRDNIAGNLSAGQRRKLSIAISIIGGSKIIFLDEPSSGMDITSRRNLWEILKRICNDKIIVLTTHYMEEASVLGKRIGIIADGKLKCLGTPLFLIERFGKFMSVNIIKEPDAKNEQIIKFFKEKVEDVEYEILSEEILFRIPKPEVEEDEKNDNRDNLEFLSLSENSSKEEPRESTSSEHDNNFSYKKFFEDLDNAMDILKIKSYTASMPTLEDVFLNVASSELQKVGDKQQKFNNGNSENDKILFEEDNFGNYEPSKKFFLDLRIALKKRLFGVIRDLKTFVLEILCPIILVLIGLAVGKVTIISETEPFVPNLNDAFKSNNVYYGSNNNVDIDNFIVDDGNTKAIKLEPLSNNENDTLAIYDYLETIYNKKDQNNFGVFFLLSHNDTNYEFVEYLNSSFKMSATFFTPKFLNQISKEIDPNVKITFTHHPLPILAEVIKTVNEAKNMMLGVFVCIAFSLIPANFITSIVKERVNNSKHLMKVSGITLLSYWISNFIFELLKYYIEGGIIMIIIALFDQFPKYFWVLYLLYGPAMIAFTYLISFIFETESAGQNCSILMNLLLGALCSLICVVLTMNPSTKKIGKGLSYVFRLIPSFPMGYAFIILLNRRTFFFLELPVMEALYAKDSKILSVKFIGTDLLYLAGEAIIYTLGIVLIEKLSYGSKTVNEDKIAPDDKYDQRVKAEIKRSQEGIISISNDEPNKKTACNTENTNLQQTMDYAVRIKNLQKVYTKCGLCGGTPVKEAVKNISFCVEYGECFGMLGLNGAGKTSIFKAITQEHRQTHGGIYIDGVDTSKRFEDIHDMFGYCPQYDAIFEYMTVYENLEFYARIKGIDLSKVNKMITAFIDEMSLTQYTNKIAGNLSGGNKRKLSVAISMICNPPIILLDEPSTGMDPEARRFMWAIIHKISTKRKKSAVIMTTHSMDEAETLCRRMAIMVDGEFVCLGTAQEIKDTYGYGFEIDIRIKPFTERQFKRMIHKAELDEGTVVKIEDVKLILKKLNKENYYEEIKEGRIGGKLLAEINHVGKVSLYVFCSWIHYVNCALKAIRDITDHFDVIKLTEFIENNFLFKIKKGKESKSIGFLFGLIETKRKECNITEYSIQPTSLEQIFNAFASEKGDKDDGQYKKIEIDIDKKLLGKLVY